MGNPEDLFLISRVVIADDRRALDRLVRKYQSPIRRFFLNLTMGDTFLSDDLAQETFIKAYLNIRSFKGLATFSTWIFRIAYNVFYDSVKARKYYEDLSADEVNKIQSTVNEMMDENFDLHNALKVLTKVEQTAILLSYMEDKTHREIARIMDLPLGTVKTHIQKGKEKIAVFLKKEEYGHK